MAKSPAAILYDESGNPVGTETLPLRTDPTGDTAQPISAAELPLPAGAATSVKQDTGNTSLGNIDGKTPTLVSGRVPTDGSGVIQPISAASLPLPASAATETTLGTRLAEATFTARVPTLGQKAMAGSVAVVVASDQGPITVTMDTGTYAGQVEGRAADGVAPVGNPVLIAGSDNTNVQVLLTDSFGRLSTVPPGSTSVIKGFADGRIVLASPVIAAVRETTYTEQTTNAQRSIASANVADTAAGTGARTVKITYYNQTMAGPFTTVVTLNGTTYVNTTATDICFIEKIEVLTVGSGLTNAGILTLKAATAGGGATIWTVAAGSGQTFGAHHYVAVGMTAYVTGLCGGIKGADAGAFFLRAATPLTANSFEKQISDLVRVVGNSSFLRTYGTAIVAAGPARITAYVSTDSSTSRTYYASFDYYEQ